MDHKNGLTNPLSQEEIEKQKAELETLVNAGKLTRESALAIAEKLGLISAAKIERTSSITKSTQLFNFSVYKWSKGRTVQRLILQFDFQSKTLSSIQHGTRTKKVTFTEITSYQSEDGLRLTIQFSSQNEYELDADTQEDKNKMCRLLEAVMRSMATAPNLDTSEYSNEVPSPTPYPAEVEQVPTTTTTEVLSNGTLEHGITKGASHDAHTALSEEERIDKALLSDSGLTSPILSSPPIKEDMVEKKGHSAKFMLWAKRWLRVCEGELMYYKPDDIENALNIIPLTPGVTEVKKISHNQFNVNLSGSNRVFNFRALPSAGKSAQQNRNEWCEAIQNGCYKRRESAAGLRKGTVTAKQIMPKAPTSSIIRRLTLRRASSPNDQAGSSPTDEGGMKQYSESPPQTRKAERRSKTFAGSGSYKKPRLSFQNKSPDEAEDVIPVALRTKKLKKRTQRSGSQFYDNEDITRRIIEPRDFPELNLKDKGAKELLLMLRPQFNELVPIIQTFTIGSSEVDQMIIRIDSIICALEEEFSERTGTPLRERTSITQSDTQDESSSSPEHQQLSTVIEQSTSNRSSRHASPALPTPGMGVVSPKGVGSPERAISPSASDEPTSEDSEIKLRSGASSRTSLRMSLKKLISPEELEKVLSPEELKHVLGEMEMEDDAQTASVHSSSSHKSTPITSPIHEEHTSTGTPPPAMPLFPSDTTPPTGVPNAPPPPPLFPGIPGAPPPPPLFPGVPGAPPPPPLFSGSGPPPPPPLGGGFSFASLLPPKKIPTPGVKLRKIHWDPLKPQIVMESGWMEWGKNDKIPSINLKDLENLFGVDKDKDKKATPNLVRKIEMKTLLDTTRSRNIEIFLPTFPYPLVSLSSTLDKQLNVVTEPSELGLDHVIALKRYQPTEEEKEMYKKYAGDKNNLQNGDIFLVKLCEVPLLSIRLDLLFTIREFPSNFEGFQPSLDLAWQATRELKHSKHFVDVLCYVLAVGNYLNAGSRQGGAYGFRLAILPKLVESYGQNKKTSLLHFLVQQIHSKQPELLDMPVNMEAVAKSSDISITGILAELEVMQKELDKIERYANKVVEQSKMDKKTADKLLKDVKGFVKQYREELTNLDSKGHEMNENYRELLKQFGEPPNTDSEDFFSQVAKFLTQFKRVSLELYPPPPPSPKVERRPPTIMTANKLVAIDEVDSTPPMMTSLSVPSIVQSPSTDSLSNKTRPKSHIVTTLTQVGPNLRPVHRGRSTIQRNQLKPKDGYLEKLTKDGKKWKKRYFELESSNLHYYEGKGQKYSDTIKLYCVPVKLSSDDRKIVTIETDKRVWSLRAENEHTAEDWLTALQTHSQGTAR